MPFTPSLIGKQFGTLKVIADAPVIRGYRASLCRCRTCGTEKVFRNVWLVKRTIQECCCNRTGFKKHGHAGFRNHSKIYNAWGEMLARCNNPRHAAYHNYGGRGIKVCKRWIQFENFLEDMGEKPAGLTLERKNNNGDYEPGNVKWATRAEQSYNKRNSLVFTVRGITSALSDLCRQFNVPYSRVYPRIKKGWTIEDAIFGAPLGEADYPSHLDSNKTRHTFTVRGMTGSIGFLCRHFKIAHYITAKRRVRNGWAPEAALFTAPDANKVRY